MGRISQLLLTAILAATFSHFSTQAAFSASKWEQYSQAAEKAYMSRDFAEAEKNFLLALKESEKFDKSDKRLASTVYNLGLIYQQEEKFDLAEQTYNRALDLLSGIYGANHERTAQVHIDLADLYRSRSESEDEKKKEWRSKAVEQYQLAVDGLVKVYEKSKLPLAPPPKEREKGKTALEQVVKPTPPITRKDACELLVKTLTTFADFHADDDEFAPAEPIYKQALNFEVGELGPDARKVALDEAHLGEFFCVQGKYSQAEPLFKDALRIIAKDAGTESLDFAKVQYNAGGLYYDQGEFAQAEELFKHALKIFENDGSVKPAELALKSIALADVFDMQGKTNDAHSTYQRSIATLEKDSDPQALVSALKQYQKHLLMMNDKAEAGKVSARIKELKAKAQ